MEFKTVSSETVYRGRVFNVRRDLVELPNGQRTRLDVIEHKDAVTLLPLDDQGRVWFVRQYRHPAGQFLLELPAGVVEEGELPETCARREVREEIGMAAGQIQKIGEFYLAPGYSAEFMHVYLARDLRPDALQPDEDEFLSVEQVPLEQAYHMAASGEIKDAKTLSALFLARDYVKN